MDGHRALSEGQLGRPARAQEARHDRDLDRKVGDLDAKRTGLAATARTELDRAAWVAAERPRDVCARLGVPREDEQAHGLGSCCAHRSDDRFAVDTRGCE